MLLCQGYSKAPLFIHSFFWKMVYPPWMLTASNPLVLEVITQEEVVYIYLSKIRKTSPGPDNIPYWFFKNFNGFLTPVIHSIFNKILTSATIPAQWRHAVITPIQKVQKNKDFNALRPISVTVC
jgi:hypothetical protein